MRNYLILIFIAFAALCSSCAGDEGTNDKLRLRLDPELGEEYQIQMEIGLNMRSAGISSKTELTFDALMQVTEVMEDTIFFETEYERMQVKQTVPFMGTIEFDSDDPSTANGQFSQQYQDLSKEILNKTGLLKLSRSGQVLASSGFGEVETDEFQSPFSGGNGQNYLSTIMAVYPEEEVGKGDSWQKEIRVAGQFPVILHNTYTIESVKKDEVIILISGDIRLDEGGMEEMPYSTEGFAGTVKGEMSVDRKTGWTRSSNVVQNIKTRVGQGEQRIPMEMETTIKVQTTNM